MHRFFDIVINTAAFASRRNDGGEIVVGQGHICRTFCYISTGDAHCAADIRRFERRRVVHTVAGHGDDLSGALPGFDDADFIGR